MYEKEEVIQAMKELKNQLQETQKKKREKCFTTFAEERTQKRCTVADNKTPIYSVQSNL